jgi:putative transposase
MRYKLDKSAHSVYSLHYHLILVVKFRKRMFIEDEVSERLKDITYDISKRFGVEILEQEVDKDHLHIIFKAKPTLEITKYINSLKGVTGRHLLKEFPQIKKRLYGGHFWSPSYCLLTTGQVSLSVLKKYVESQRRA